MRVSFVRAPLFSGGEMPRAVYDMRASVAFFRAGVFPRAMRAFAPASARFYGHYARGRYRAARRVVAQPFAALLCPKKRFNVCQAK